MTVRSRINDATARRVTIDRLYAGILPSHRCTCGDLALDHETKLGRDHRYTIKCVIPGCRCRTFNHVTTQLFDQAADATTKQRMSTDDTDR